MATEDTRAYYTFYGIATDDWSSQWSGTSGATYILVKNYISDGCSTGTSSDWVSGGIDFVYPHNIKKVYHLEGVVEGQITFAAQSSPSLQDILDYTVSIIRVDEDATSEAVASTGVITTSDTLLLTDGVADEIVYPFWIDVFAEGGIEFGENQRIGIRIEWNTETAVSNGTAILMHDNDATYEDIKVTVPLLL